MAKTQRDRDQATAERRNKAGEVELRHRVSASAIHALAQLMAWGDHSQRTECLQTLLLNLHASDPAGSRHLLRANQQDGAKAELRHRVRPGILAILDDLMARGGHNQQDKLLDSLLLNVHALGRDRAVALLQPPRHEIHISPTVARQLYQQGAEQAGRLDRQEQ